MARHMTVLVTAPDEEEGARIARALVERRLAACVNIIPRVRSIYRWKGKIWDEGEVMMIAKSSPALAPAIVDAVKELHSYEVPEIVCIPIETGSGDYLDWIDASVDAPAGGDEGEF